MYIFQYKLKLLSQNIKIFLYVSSIVTGRTCPKAWAFTRVPSYELNAPNAIEIRNMFGRRQCQDECLQETRIVCRLCIVPII
jgi:hypothetical protein